MPRPLQTYQKSPRQVLPPTLDNWQLRQPRLLEVTRATRALPGGSMVTVWRTPSTVPAGAGTDGQAALAVAPHRKGPAALGDRWGRGAWCRHGNRSGVGCWLGCGFGLGGHDDRRWGSGTAGDQRLLDTLADGPQRPGGFASEVTLQGLEFGAILAGLGQEPEYHRAAVTDSSFACLIQR